MATAKVWSRMFPAFSKPVPESSARHSALASAPVSTAPLPGQVQLQLEEALQSGASLVKNRQTNEHRWRHENERAKSSECHPSTTLAAGFEANLATKSNVCTKALGQVGQRPTQQSSAAKELKQSHGVRDAGICKSKGGKSIKKVVCAKTKAEADVVELLCEAFETPASTCSNHDRGNTASLPESDPADAQTCVANVKAPLPCSLVKLPVEGLTGKWAGKWVCNFKVKVVTDDSEQRDQELIAGWGQQGKSREGRASEDTWTLMGDELVLKDEDLLMDMIRAKRKAPEPDTPFQDRRVRQHIDYVVDNSAFDDSPGVGPHNWDAVKLGEHGMWRDVHIMSDAARSAAEECLWHYNSVPHTMVFVK